MNDPIVTLGMIGAWEVIAILTSLTLVAAVAVGTVFLLIWFFRRVSPRKEEAFRIDCNE